LLEHFDFGVVLIILIAILLSDGINEHCMYHGVFLQILIRLIYSTYCIYMCSLTRVMGFKFEDSCHGGSSLSFEMP
jgi:hypothetical protein